MDMILCGKESRGRGIGGAWGHFKTFWPPPIPTSMKITRVACMPSSIRSSLLAWAQCDVPIYRISRCGHLPPVTVNSIMTAHIVKEHLWSCRDHTCVHIIHRCQSYLKMAAMWVSDTEPSWRSILISYLCPRQPIRYVITVALEWFWQNLFTACALVLFCLDRKHAWMKRPCICQKCAWLMQSIRVWVSSVVYLLPYY